MAALPPVPQPIALFPQFIAQGPETIVLREKVMSLSGDSFEIKLASGSPILQVEGNVMSISGKKKVRDMQGNHLFTIAKEHFHLHATYVVKSSLKLMGSKATATFQSHHGKQEKLVMNGNWFNTSADIVDEAMNDAVVARINRKILSGKDLFFGQQTYGVQVAPGVDLALIVALCICLDEKNNEGK
ncbi:tubby C-terminal-like domain-containing protein [Ampelomyces quisqualis]|uniref:Tubby C-terminal-like domain-containing protein n=1 Tax=Ampelomyces quisqualis TaxID=50730 RepID=A0A6A5QUD0_AMPQU|nr:tubby C-terminal-like domain-containing protein [Ampelomyces quisqualis]